MGIVNSFVDYLTESQKELKKVNWPSRQQTLRYSFIVILMSLAVAFFLGGVDQVFTFILDKFLLNR